LVDASNSSHRILSTKVEITLKKATQGQKWAALEGTQPLTKSSNGTTGPKAEAAIPSTVKQPGNVAGPAYPTSSKSGPKNWDKLASDLTKKKKPGKEDSEDSEDDMKVDSEDESGDAVDGFFKKLFKNSDPDTQRAMMKSFQESNGTALSTSWEEVGKKRVEPVDSKAD
jgi:suppressor of G2 allele of SKP1